jgi:hypothetical protein
VGPEPPAPSAPWQSAHWAANSFFPAAMSAAVGGWVRGVCAATAVPIRAAAVQPTASLTLELMRCVREFYAHRPI